MAGSAANLLSYFSPPLPPETDASFERARADRLRRRIRVYCVVMGVVAAFKGLAAWNGGQGWSVLAAVLEIGLVGTIFIWTRPGNAVDRRVLAQVSMGLIAASGVLWLVAGRFDGLGAGTGLFTMLWRHLIASALLPWNWREAVFAIGLLAVANAAIVTFDVLRGASGIGLWIGAVAFAPTMAVPGTLLSWWRHSKYRQRHRLVTESEMYRSLSKEMESARRVHEACLPAPIVHPDLRLFYVYQPYRQLGGDVLYLHPPSPRPGEPFTLILLDVVGHGIAAALTVNRIVGEIERIYAEAALTDASPELSPSDLALGLNRYVGLTLASHSLFATAFIARIDPQRDRLTWVNCGHPSGFLMSPDGKVKRLEGDTMMLGVADDDLLGAVDTDETFGSGSVLLLCTDGATEARDPSGNALLTAGFEQLLTTVARSGEPPSEWPSRLAESIAAFRDGPTDDDLLLATVARLESRVVAMPTTRREPLAVSSGHHGG